MPFDSITGFSDPSVPFGFKLEPRIMPETPLVAAAPRSDEPVKPARAPASPRPSRAPSPTRPADRARTR